VKRILLVVFKGLLFPVRLGWRLLERVLRMLFVPMTGHVDSSERLSNLLDQISSSMATQRGLLLMVGTSLLVASLLIHAVMIVLLVSSDSFNRSLYWLCIPFAVLHVSMLIGFTGIMLAVPLGQGYKDK
jgi:hypothetical protein